MAKIRTLLLSGANNHDWKRFVAFLRDVLEKSGKFAVTMAENPSASLEDAADTEGLPAHLLRTTTGPPWSEKAKANFVAAVEGGTVACHPPRADNAFPGWVE